MILNYRYLLKHALKIAKQWKYYYRHAFLILPQQVESSFITILDLETTGQCLLRVVVYYLRNSDNKQYKLILIYYILLSKLFVFLSKPVKQILCYLYKMNRQNLWTLKVSKDCTQFYYSFFLMFFIVSTESVLKKNS